MEFRVSRGDQGNPTALGDMRQQMFNVYQGLQKILAHYELTFADVIVEHVFTADMASSLEVSSEYRKTLH
ncbi:MAG: hypothetical protein AAF756_23150 [Pseudomonadota bacterium]